MGSGRGLSVNRAPGRSRVAWANLKALAGPLNRVDVTTANFKEAPKSLGKPLRLTMWHGLAGSPLDAVRSWPSKEHSLPQLECSKAKLNGRL